jgi:hypothetical protein
MKIEKYFNPEDYLHPDDLGLFQRVTALAFRLSRVIGKTCIIEPKRRPLSDAADGLCYYDRACVAIKVRNKDRAGSGGRWWPRPLPWESIALTVAHEVAHLEHPNHGKEFRELEARLRGLI